jgi:hypothetical protein
MTRSAFTPISRAIMKSSEAARISMPVRPTRKKAATAISRMTVTTMVAMSMSAMVTPANWIWRVSPGRSTPIWVGQYG